MKKAQIGSGWLAFGLMASAHAASVNTPSNTPAVTPAAPAALSGQSTANKKTATEWLKENVVLGYNGQLYGPNLANTSLTSDETDSMATVGTAGTEPLYLWNRVNVGWKINPTMKLVVQQRFVVGLIAGWKVDPLATRINFSKSNLIDSSIATTGLGVNLQLPTVQGELDKGRLGALAVNLATSYKLGGSWSLEHLVQARYHARVAEWDVRTKKSPLNDWEFYGSLEGGYAFNDWLAGALNFQVAGDHKLGLNQMDDGFYEDMVEIQPQVKFTVGAVEVIPYVAFQPVHFANTSEFQNSTYFGMYVNATAF